MKNVPASQRSFAGVVARPGFCGRALLGFSRWACCRLLLSSVCGSSVVCRCVGVVGRLVLCVSGVALLGRVALRFGGGGLWSVRVRFDGVDTALVRCVWCVVVGSIVRGSCGRGR